MASKSSERMVMAYDEHGQLVPTPESETVNIPECPEPRDKSGKRRGSKDGATPVTPRVARFFARSADELPNHLVSMELVPAERFGEPYWYVMVGFAKPLEYVMLDGSKNTKDTTGVCVFDERDARDPFFAKLPTEERAEILSRLGPSH